MQKNTKNGAPEPRVKFASEIMGIFCLCITVLLFLSVISYDARDPGLNHVVRGSARLHNWTGVFGAYLSAFLVDFVGFAAYTPCLLSATVTVKYLRKIPAWPWWRWAAFVLLAVCLAAAGAAWNIGLAEVRGGGLIGQALFEFSVRYFSQAGSLVIWVSLLLLSIQSIFGYSWRQMGLDLVQRLRNSMREAAERSRQAKSISKNAEHAAEAAASQRNISLSAVEAVEAAALQESIFREAEQAAKAAALQKNISQNAEQAAETAVLQKNVYQSAEQAAEAAALQRKSKQRIAETPPLVWPGSERMPTKDAPKAARPPLISISSSHEPLAMPDPTQKRGALGSLKGLFTVRGAADPAAQSGETPPWLDDLEHGRIGAAGPAPQTPPRQKTTPSATSSDNPAPTAQPQGGLLDGVIIDEQYQAPKNAEPKARRAPAKLPGLALLRQTQNSAQAAVSRQELEAKGRTLMSVLGNFSIQAELVRITPGPVVTSFELRPAPGVKSARISALSDDIALGLKAMAVRIQAPIPGTDTVGIEIPNSAREIVNLRELLAAREFQSAASLLTLALGKDSTGVPTVADLARMPHMLVAGATGTGKSVFLNSVLMSLLYKARPDEVKLLLVDPKRIELAVYTDVPHLVHPIVTDMSLAKNALAWAVAEMERRYGDIARLGVRNIAAYNEKLGELGTKRQPALADLQPMPYLVIIIDELADLMLTAGKDVETSIVRLAQLARAAGIHLLLATQRPSVDVVTGLIKANFPCRISFQVSSKHDSRTILDTVGAEHLLGNGDMLYKPAGGRFQRLHGAFVSDEEVAAVADYWRAQQPPDYRVDFSEFGAESHDGGSDAFSAGEDQKYAEAVDFVRQQGKASISLIQRRFRIGFNSAARIIEQMERDGIIGPADGSKPRVVR